MTPGEEACPRCARTFHCGVNDSEPCACTTLTLDDALLAQLRERYDRCLCLSCLAELQASRPTR
jgi:Cysteine-rich CWC